MKTVRKTIGCICLAIVMTFAVSLISPEVTNVTTVEAATKKVKINKKKATIYVGKTVTLKLKNNKKKVKWSSSNKKVATVSKKGKVKGKKAGKVVITAKVGSKKYKCKVTVKKKSIPISTIILSETNKSVVIGSKFTLTTTIVPQNATNKTLTWQSINNNVATVNNGVIQAVGIGTTQIYVSTNNGISASCTVTVTRDYLSAFNNLSEYEKAGIFAIYKIDTIMKAESKSYKIDDGMIGVFEHRSSILGQYEIMGKAAIKIFYKPSDFLSGLIPNFIVCINEDGSLLAYGTQDDSTTERWTTTVELGTSNTLTASELYEIYIGLQQGGYDVVKLCNNL